MDSQLPPLLSLPLEPHDVELLDLAGLCQVVRDLREEGLLGEDAFCGSARLGLVEQVQAEIDSGPRVVSHNISVDVRNGAIAALSRLYRTRSTPAGRRLCRIAGKSSETMNVSTAATRNHVSE